MRYRLVAPLAVLVIVAAAILAAVLSGPAAAQPNRNTVCTTCHSGTASGTVTAVPSTSTPAAGASYTVAVTIGLTSSGSTGYHIASTDAAGTATDWVAVYSGISSQTSWAATMTAPATAGTYYYKVWCAKGKNDATGQAKAATYSITVPAAVPTAAITGVTPNHAQTGASVVIAGTNLGSGGTVRFGTTTAATTSWSATSVTATVPASLAPGATSVTVQPTGGAASNAVAFTVDAPPAPGDTTAPTTTAGGVTANAWYSDSVHVTLTATDDAGGSGVASITYAVDGGAPTTVAGSSVTAIIGDHSAGLGAAEALALQGPHTLTYYATDVAGNDEAAHELTVNIDTMKPATRAPRSAKVIRYRTATLKYAVRDATPNGGTARVVVTIKNSRGKVVKKLRLGAKPVNTPLAATFRCKLAAGTYRFSVRAIDAAGNAQANVAAQTLRVLPAN
jgi:IPT/TIG domain